MTIRIAFLTMDSGEGALRRLPCRIENMPVHDEGTLLDADCPKDYQALLARAV